MKKIMSIILILVMCISFVSCREKEPEVVEYTPYYSTYLSEGNSLCQILREKNYKGNAASELVFVDDKIYLPKDSNVDQIKSFEYFGKEYLLKYSSSHKTSYAECENEIAKNDRIIDSYWYKDDYIRLNVDYERETGNIVFVFSPDRDKFAKTGNFSDEEAKNKAEEFIKSIYGKKALNGYQPEIHKSDREPTVEVTYYKVVSGVICYDYVGVKFDLSGNFVGFSANNYGYLNKISDELTDERINNAINKLREDLGEEYIIEKDASIIYLEVKSGIPFIDILVQRKDNPDNNVEVYINLYN